MYLSGDAQLEKQVVDEDIVADLEADDRAWLGYRPWTLTCTFSSCWDWGPVWVKEKETGEGIWRGQGLRPGVYGIAEGCGGSSTSRSDSETHEKLYGALGSPGVLGRDRGRRGET